MAEEIKGKIVKYLADHAEEEFSVSRLTQGVGHTYPSVSKWVEVLAAEGRIIVRDFGNIKLVSYNKKCQTE